MATRRRRNTAEVDSKPVEDDGIDVLEQPEPEPEPAPAPVEPGPNLTKIAIALKHGDEVANAMINDD